MMMSMVLVSCFIFQTLLLGLSFKEFSWTCAEPKGPKDAQKSLPCLLIQFDDTENDEPVKKVLQIFSKEVGSIAFPL